MNPHADLEAQPGQSMAHTFVTVLCHRKVTELTAACLQVLHHEGAIVEVEKGWADLANGHSNVITRVMDRLVEEQADPERQVVMFADDDMAFPLRAAVSLTEYTRRTGRAASGVYMTVDGRNTATKDAGLAWECGWGFLAVRLDQLIQIASRLPRVQGMNPGGVIPFSCSGIHPSLPTRWTPNDYWFCRELGGVDLLPIGVGHIKAIPIYPDEESLRLLAAGQGLGLDGPPVQHQRGWSKRGVSESDPE